MSVRQSLLAILDQGPCYGYQLRAEFERRTGATWPLNVGQIYNTLERLERDGLVSRDEPDEQGHVFWRITGAGRAEAATWLASPVERATGTRDELAIKVALAATLPGVGASSVIETQRRATLAQLRTLEDTAAGLEADDPEQLAASVVLDAMIVAARAQAEWLERTQRRLRDHPHRALELASATDRPKRGRPAKARA